MNPIQFMTMMGGDNAEAIVRYVTSVPYFWETMSGTLISSMFLGATMYNGELKKLAKGMVVLGSYAFLIFLLTATRIKYVADTIGIKDSVQAHAGLVTWLFVTVFYFVGLIVGVLASKGARASARSRIR